MYTDLDSVNQGSAQVYGQTRFSDIHLTPRHLERINALHIADQQDTTVKHRKIASEFSVTGMLVVLLCHAAAFGGMLVVSRIEPVKTEPAAPMMVSLVNNPQMEELKHETPPEPPKPKPVVQKQKPLERTVKPVEQPVASTPVPQEAPPVLAQASSMVKEPEVAEKPQPLPEPEPVIEPPRFGAAYLQNPAPEYPPLARRAGEQGKVIMRVIVSEKGDAETVEVESSSGYARLDKAAVDAVTKWRFIPARRNNQAIRQSVRVPLKFSLNS